jgi:hypothetical protein
LSRRNTIDGIWIVACSIHVAGYGALVAAGTVSLAIGSVFFLRFFVGAARTFLAFSRPMPRYARVPSSPRTAARFAFLATRLARFVGALLAGFTPSFFARRSSRYFVMRAFGTSLCFAHT